jgi:hypothetical protein
MSKSNPRLQNPCQKFIDLKADKGTFHFWDKETEKQISLPLPIYFIVLDELSTISGYNKKNDCGIYSNEVHKLDEILRVKTFKGGESITGLYKDVRDSIVALGGKFTKSVYALLINPDKSTEMVNFKFRGAAFSSWIEKKINVDNLIIGIVDFSEETNGATTYKVPIFKAFKLTPELDQKAIEMDKILQAYLKEYNSQQPEKEIAKAETKQEEVEVFESRKQEVIKKSLVNDEFDPNIDPLPF